MGIISAAFLRVQSMHPTHRAKAVKAVPLGHRQFSTLDRTYGADCDGTLHDPRAVTRPA
jgi:hypothetical protein